MTLYASMLTYSQWTFIINDNNIINQVLHKLRIPLRNIRDQRRCWSASTGRIIEALNRACTSQTNSPSWSHCHWGLIFIWIDTLIDVLKYAWLLYKKTQIRPPSSPVLKTNRFCSFCLNLLRVRPTDTNSKEGWWTEDRLSHSCCGEQQSRMYFLPWECHWLIVGVMELTCTVWLWAHQSEDSHLDLSSSDRLHPKQDGTHVVSEV